MVTKLRRADKKSKETEERVLEKRMIDFGEQVDRRIDGMESMLEKLRNDMKKAYKASLYENIQQFVAAKESLATAVNSISEWERIFARATTEKDTKEVLQIFKVLQKD